MGQIVDAIVYDLTHGGNQRTRAAANSYFDSSGNLLTVVNDEKLQTLAAINYGLTVIDRVLSNLAPATNYQTTNSFSPAHPQIIDATYLEETDAQSQSNLLIGIITDAISAEVNTNVPKAHIPNNTIYVKSGTLVEHTPILVPAYTAIVGDELRSTKITPAGVITGAADVPKSIAAIARLQAIMSSIVTNASVTKSAGNSASQVTTRVAGSAGAVTATGFVFATECIEANRAFLVAEVHAFIAATYPSYTYTIAACTRDVNRYLDAIIYDIIYTGNCRTLSAAKLYANSVSGCLTEDMFYMRNGTGLRNCTLSGLTGSLGSANSYGTKRPSAGAFVSLDPGYGPADSDAWIATRSPYVQNVTTFGTACIGLKIDGDLHDGGNDSIVANDFTQILDNGIGVWVTNLGRAELVSVFSYYGHIGYLAENGGKIRATNGNSSYGDFGAVAEGVDATEVPVTGTVDNRSTEANIVNVLTDGNQILLFEYSNAGLNYAKADTTISTSGGENNAVISAENVYNGGVYEVRLMDPATNLGGAGYVTSTNTAQLGTATQITISNTDGSLSATYTGMAIWIVAGTGAGQYGYIDTYTAGTKIATVLK
ncbi:MAG: hypothetical protein ACKVJK_20370, partial [Methylophagaceae bacterium]